MDFFAEQPDTEDRYWLLIFLGELLSEAGSIFLIYTLTTENICAPKSCLQTLPRSYGQGQVLKYPIRASYIVCLANSADPDQTAPEEESDLGLHCMLNKYCPKF